MGQHRSPGRAVKRRDSGILTPTWKRFQSDRDLTRSGAVFSHFRALAFACGVRYLRSTSITKASKSSKSGASEAGAGPKLLASAALVGVAAVLPSAALA